MQILISTTTALVVLIAYSLGVWTGSRFYCPDRGKGHLLRNSGRTGADGKMEMDDGIALGSCLEPVELMKRPLRGNTGSAVADFCNTESVGIAVENPSDAERQQRSADVFTDAERQKRTVEAFTDAEKQKRFEEDLKAFQDCMNYCQEKAYGVET